MTLVIHALHGGGSEHVVAMMASHWAEQGRPVTLITLDTVANDAIAVSPRVHRVGLGLLRESKNVAQALVNTVRRVRALRRAIVDSRPEHVVSFVDRMNVLTLLACRGTGLNVVVSERIDVRFHSIGRIWEWLRRRTYPWARAIVVQTEAARLAVQALTSRTPVIRIDNCVLSLSDDSSPDPATRTLATEHQWIGAVGRLSFQKGFDLLLSAFAQVASRFPNWRLAIVGEGTERAALEAQIERLDLKEQVRLLGWDERPWVALVGAEVFVLSSRYEGFPNALLEAMARGLSVVAFDCPSGPAEIIRDGVDGLLVPAGDVAALAEALGKLLAQPERRWELAAHAIDVKSRFSSDRYFAAWDAVLRNV